MPPVSPLVSRLSTANTAANNTIQLPINSSNTDSHLQIYTATIRVVLLIFEVTSEITASRKTDKEDRRVGPLHRSSLFSGV